LREHLLKERRASQHTCEAYVRPTPTRLRSWPAQDHAGIEVEQLDAPLMLAFLEQQT
jgi:hypothetical protein